MLKSYISDSRPGRLAAGCFFFFFLVYDAGASKLQNEGWVGTKETITPVPSLVSPQTRIYNLLAEELWERRRKQLIEPWWAGIKNS